LEEENKKLKEQLEQFQQTAKIEIPLKQRTFLQVFQAS